MLVTAASVVLVCMYSNAEHPPIDVARFHASISRGDVDGVRRMIDDGVDVNVVDDCDCTPVMTAATFGRPEVLRMLLEAGADPHRKGRADRTSMYCAAGAMRNSTECVRLLLRYGVQADEANRRGRTPLMVACLYGHFESAVLLLDAGANHCARDTNGQGPLWYAACAYGDDVRLLRLLVALGCDPDRVDDHGWSPLHHAASAGRLSAVKVLVSAGADWHRPTRAGKTPVDLAKRLEVRLALGETLEAAQPIETVSPDPTPDVPVVECAIH